MIYGFLFTLISGLFFLIGIVLLNNIKDKEKISLITISVALVVMIGLIIFDIIPEIDFKNNFWLFIPVILGFIFLLFMDKLIPHHHHHHKDDCSDKVEHVKHLNHIGVLTIIALGFHNMIEGAGLYNVTLTSISSGFLMMVSIGCHNIPLGFQIGNSLNNNKSRKYLILFLILSAVIGALVVSSFGSISPIAVNVILAVTLGMLIYICIFELLEEVYYKIKEKEVLYGIIIGMIILFLTSLF